MLPQLRRIEERFPDEVVVVGVHVGKFDAEKETYNVRSAVMRHDVRHPVVNDAKGAIWRAYAVRAWPTLALIDPQGCIIGTNAGEFDGETLGNLLEDIIADCDVRGLIDRRPIEVILEKKKQLESLLSFPGKALAVEAGPSIPIGGALFVADTDHHRVLRFGLRDGRLRAVYGSGEPGFRDGSAKRSRFRSPHGLCTVGDALYVADTENHAVRRISLDTGSVTTAAGDGIQADYRPTPGEARKARLNSPWDVLAVGDVLYIAMAGSHQIWVLHLVQGELAPFAGDGREALHDGPHLAARLAQPSGLAEDGRRLWFVDSETSSLRSIPLLSSGPRPGALTSGSPEVRTHIGRGLFDFGDRDGDREEARLQHPLGVGCAGGRVYVADSYNNKIKVFDPATSEIDTLAGCGEPGLYDGAAGEASFWEPSGISVAAGTLYVADTNNHAIRKVDLASGAVESVVLEE